MRWFSRYRHFPPSLATCLNLIPETHMVLEKNQFLQAALWSPQNVMVHVSTHTHIIIQNKLHKCNYSFKRSNQLIQSPFRIIVIDYQLFKFGKVWLLMIHATRLCWQYFPSQGQVNCDVFKKKKNFNLGRREKLITKDCIWSSKVSHCWKTLSPIMDQPGVFIPKDRLKSYFVISFLIWKPGLGRYSSQFRMRSHLIRVRTNQIPKT